MENPFRDRGPLDKLLPFLTLAVGVGLLIRGITGSAFWTTAAGAALTLLAVLRLHGRRHARRHSPGRR